MRRAVAVLIALVLLAAGALLAAWSWADGAGAQKVIQQDVVFDVPKGASGPRLPHLLKEAQLVPSASRTRWYLKLHPAYPKFGKHQLKAGMTLAEVLQALGEKPLAEDVPVKILEGWRLVDTDEALSSGAEPLLPKGAYLAAAKDPGRFKIPFPFSATTLEGYLYPETYLMPAGHVEADKLIQRQLEAFDEKFAEPYKDEIARCGHSLQELVTVASMLEREEPDPANRPMVAGIIYKRLARGIPLGVDATSRYTLEDWNDRRHFLERLRDPNDPYNSRLRQGLPPTPIGAPTVASLLAALRPTASEYLFYLHDKQRHVHFARDAKEHEANRKKYDIY